MLNRNNPSAAATRTGENNVDNVEMVTIDNPVAGTEYTVIIDHDGTLNGGSQAFSIIFSGITEEATAPPVADFVGNPTSQNIQYH
jgi:PKD repeat protein